MWTVGEKVLFQAKTAIIAVVTSRRDRDTWIHIRMKYLNFKKEILTWRTLAIGRPFEGDTEVTV